MAEGTIKIRARAKDDVIEVKSLISHPMETGMRKDKKGDVVPAYFIQEVVVEHNGNMVMTAYWGIAISQNPYLSFKIKGGKKGDQIRLTWTDNKGGKDSLISTVV